MAVRRLTRILPVGTVPAGIGVAILALASYVHLAFAGHALPEAEMANLSVLWAVVFTVGLGIFFPVEQEVTRVIAARRARSWPTRAVWRRGNAVSFRLLTALAVIALAGAVPIASRLFVGELSLIPVTLGGLLGLAASAPLRGAAAGAGRFDLYGTHLGVDGVARMVIAAGLTAVGVKTAAAFGVVLAIAPVLATIALVLPVRAAAGAARGATGAAAGPRLTWREFGSGIPPLVGSALVGQLVLNSPVVAVRLLDPNRTALVAGLLAALILVRAPIFVFAALQASLLSGLASSVTDTDLRQFRRLLLRASAVVTGLALVAAVPASAAGPWLIRVLFGAPDTLDRTDFAILAVGTWGYLLALVLGQAVMALHQHRVQLAAWIAGAGVLAVVTAIPGDLLTRVETAYALASWAVAGGLATYLLLARPEAVLPTAVTARFRRAN